MLSWRCPIEDDAWLPEMEVCLVEGQGVDPILPDRTHLGCNFFMDQGRSSRSRTIHSGDLPGDYFNPVPGAVLFMAAKRAV